MFSNPQVRPFQVDLVDEPCELQVEARHDGERLTYHVNLHQWKFLEPLLADRPPTTPTDKTDSLNFWRAALGYGEDEELEFVEVQGLERPIPDDVLSCWPDNADYEFEIWSRERARFLKWVALAQALEAELPQAHSWEEGPPEDKALLSLEFELRHSLPNRAYAMKRLHALGILAGEADLQLLGRLGCQKLQAFAQAAEAHRWVGQFLEGMWLGKTVLSSPVGVEWFLDGPPQQRYLDPLSHLKFAFHHHIKREPPQTDSSFVVSMGGRISGAFFYQRGPGGMPQLVRGGEPPLHSPLRELYQHGSWDGGDRIAELSGRAIRSGRPAWGGKLAWSHLQRHPDHGQCWIELGVALADLGHPGAGRACLQKAQELEHSFSVRGELARLWAVEPENEPDEASVGIYLKQWRTDLQSLVLQEQTAAVLCRETWLEPSQKQALRELSLPHALWGI